MVDSRSSRRCADTGTPECIRVATFGDAGECPEVDSGVDCVRKIVNDPNQLLGLGNSHPMVRFVKHVLEQETADDATESRTHIEMVSDAVDAAPSPLMLDEDFGAELDYETREDREARIQAAREYAEHPDRMASVALIGDVLARLDLRPPEGLQNG